MLEVGLAFGFETVELLNPVEGDQEYKLPLTAVAPIPVDEPTHIVALEPALAAGRGLMVTVTVLEFTQLFEFVSVMV